MSVDVKSDGSVETSSHPEVSINAEGSTTEMDFLFLKMRPVVEKTPEFLVKHLTAEGKEIAEKYGLRLDDEQVQFVVIAAMAKFANS